MDPELIDRLAATRTIEITTVGRRTGRLRRVEIWWFHVEGRFYITGTPGPRDWLANLEADPRLVVHALGQDLQASARLITDRSVRRWFFTRPGTGIDWYKSEADLDLLIHGAPMIEVVLER
jgi:deazaflavin-dependent oxidoreductase (nitroreductase family)